MEEHNQPKIIAVSGKGGVGKTSLAAVIVKLLVSAYPGKKILAIDADPAVGLSTALGIDPEKTVDDVRKEVISLVGEGKPMEDIAAGLMTSVAKRCFVMAKKAGATDCIALTGGCAKNVGLKQAIEKVLHLKVKDLPIDPQLMGALGAAEFARQKGGAKA